MISFSCDYLEGAHPKILERLLETNLDQTEGYGEDPFCGAARELIRQKIGCPDCAVHFLTGGTQTNLTFIAHALRPWQAVLAADSGHIATHETGAIEATGHKVFTCPAPEGKLTPAHIESALVLHRDHHSVVPKMVYISNATEIGTIYTKTELTALHECCRANNLYLYIDGARLAAALTARGNDLVLEDFPKYCDAFYLGGTKGGALFGEALVIVNPDIAKDFNYSLKQRGGLLAKGRLLGLQFSALLEDDLYLKLAAQANVFCQRLKSAFEDLGFSFLVDSPTNQIFPILPNALISKLRESYSFRDWEMIDADHTAVRFVTSWATTDVMVDTLIDDLRRFCHE
ncbi:MAG: low specificity L-threonine aldolase [Eubacterium sp.]|nr:low specificity L-threonine aldolase [Eubacterium sp.]